jgi:AcrR family transcriptional regulator
MIDAILAAARTVMREKGVAGLNLNEVAAMVGIKTPSLYNYFSSKMALYDALFRLGFQLTTERREALSQEYSPDWGRLHAWLDGHIQFAQEYPELFQLCFQHPVPGFVPSEESMEQSRRLYRSSVQGMAEIIEVGLIDSGLTAEQTLDVFIVVMHGLTALHLANDPDLPIGSGRFGSLAREILAPLQAYWAPKRRRGQ